MSASALPSHPVVAAVLDTVMAPLARVRAQVIPGVTGEVLELGAGTGGNFPFYDRSRVQRLRACEPDPHMRRRARRRAETVELPIELDEASAEDLPYPDASFDEVVATFVLCTVPRPERALAEARRVLRPGGRLVFAEHIAHPHRVPSTLQTALDRPWSFVAGGCHLDRPTLALIVRAGFEDVQHRRHGSAWTLVPVVSGQARAPA